MHTIGKLILGGIIGAVTGSFTGYKIAQKRYYKLADKEVSQLTAYYEDKLKEFKQGTNQGSAPSEPINDEANAEEKPKVKKGRKPKLPQEEVSSMDGQPKSTKAYVDYAKQYKSINEEESKDTNRRDLIAQEKTENKDIEIIAPEEFGDKFYNYYQDTLYYYNDGVLADDADNPITDIDNYVGSDALDSFGRYESDRVCVRNHRLQQDYEIYLSQNNFAEMHGGSVSPEDE